MLVEHKEKLMVELLFKEKPATIDRQTSKTLEVEAVKVKGGWKVKVENDADAYWALAREQATLLSPDFLDVYITIPGSPISKRFSVPGKEPEPVAVEPDILLSEEIV